MKILITLFMTFLVNSWTLNAFADSPTTEAAIPGAYCECNTPDAFFNVSNLFTRKDLELIQKRFEDPLEDRRRPIDRTLPRFRQLNAIGQVLSPNGGLSTGILISPTLVLINAHIVEKVGEKVLFRVGQTPKNSPKRWADEARGEVVARGDYTDVNNHNQEWGLVKLPNDSLSQKYGFLRLALFKSEEMIKLMNEKDGFLTAGFPGFKDPKYLWGQGLDLGPASDRVIFRNLNEIKATNSSGMSGGAVLYEIKPGDFRIYSLIHAAGPGFSLKSFGLSSLETYTVDFTHPDFKDNYSKAFQTHN